jgi:hypothetical protein
VIWTTDHGAGRRFEQRITSPLPVASELEKRRSAQRWALDT